MSLVSVNYLAILVAAVACFAWGAVWYMSLSKAWLEAVRLDPSQIKPSPVPYTISFAALLVMGWVMSGVIGHIGAVGLWPGIVTGFLLWLGFVATTLTVNHRYEGFGWDLTIIDTGQWLGVCVIMGAIIGWWGA